MRSDRRGRGRAHCGIRTGGCMMGPRGGENAAWHVLICQGAMPMHKTIVMHCNDKRRISALLAPTVSLADTFEAHLTALSVVPPVIVTGAPSGPAIVIDTHCEQYRAENPAMRSRAAAAIRHASDRFNRWTEFRPKPDPAARFDRPTPYAPFMFCFEGQRRAARSQALLLNARRLRCINARSTDRQTM